ncbi:MAG: DUF2871 domain-containing protein [Clostridia bacterium]
MGKMKRFLNVSFIYAIAAMVAGVFYRELTKFNDFTGVTALGKVHTHLFFLGMIMFLIVALFAANSELRKQKFFGAFFVFYNIGVVLTAIMMVTRGIVEVLSIEISNAFDVLISAASGVGHACTGIGIVLLFLTLKKISIKSK